MSKNRTIEWLNKIWKETLKKKAPVNQITKQTIKAYRKIQSDHKKNQKAILKKIDF